MKPLLSVVIATKNREKYCVEAIKSILNYNDDRVEITVADNSSTTKVKEYVAQLNSPFVKYSYNPAEISSIDNFNTAMDLATGEYVMLIGDDDSILPNAIELAVWGRENNVDSISSLDIYTYFWAGANPNYPNGLLQIPKVNEGLVKSDAYQTLIELLGDGIINYPFYPVPKSYHGIVKKSIMDEIKNITGNYYGALSPDIFSVIGISLLSKNHWVSGNPFSIAGVCPSSTTSDQIKGKHCGSLEEMPHLKNRKTPYMWDKLIPKFYSVTTTWGESALNALSAMNRDDLKLKFNIYPLLAQAILMNRNEIFKFSILQVEKLRKELGISSIFFWSRILATSSILTIEKLFRVVAKSFNKSKNIENVENIEVAIELIIKNNALLSTQK